MIDEARNAARIGTQHHSKEDLPTVKKLVYRARQLSDLFNTRGGRIFSVTPPNFLSNMTGASIPANPLSREGWLAIMTIVGPLVANFLLAQECCKDAYKLKCCSRRRDLAQASEQVGLEPAKSDRSPFPTGRTDRAEHPIPYTAGSHHVRVDNKPYVLTAVKPRSTIFGCWMSMKKYQLQEQCRVNKLPRSGNKEALAERLEAVGALYPTQ